jgi:very-short-patch-repair endonuclease
MAKNRDRSRDLRKNATEAEALVWRQVRNRRFADFRFRRQHELGDFIVDFGCLKHRLSSNSMEVSTTSPSIERTMSIVTRG